VKEQEIEMFGMDYSLSVRTVPIGYINTSPTSSDSYSFFRIIRKPHLTLLSLWTTGGQIRHIQQ